MLDRHQTASFDTMLDALGDVQRRILLVGLLKHNPQDDSPTIIADHERERLEEYGFIEWDKENSEVSKGPAFDEIRPLLELLDNHEDELPTDWI